MYIIRKYLQLLEKYVRKQQRNNFMYILIIIILRLDYTIVSVAIGPSMALNNKSDQQTKVIWDQGRVAPQSYPGAVL